jgi:hypothetical protein
MAENIVSITKNSSTVHKWPGKHKGFELACSELFHKVEVQNKQKDVIINFKVLFKIHIYRIIKSGDPLLQKKKRVRNKINH